MKKKIILISIILVLILISCRQSNIKYPSGRDTVKSYGDGTFQIVGRDPSGVYYGGEGSPLISSVDRYYEHNDMVYIIGHDSHQAETIIYGIIDTNQNTIHVLFTEEVYLADRLLESPSIEFLQDFADFSENDKVIFEKLKNEELGKTIEAKR